MDWRRVCGGSAEEEQVLKTLVFDFVYALVAFFSYRQRRESFCSEPRTAKSSTLSVPYRTWGTARSMASEGVATAFFGQPGCYLVLDLRSRHVEPKSSVLVVPMLGEAIFSLEFCWHCYIFSDLVVGFLVLLFL